MSWWSLCLLVATMVGRLAAAQQLFPGLTSCTPSDRNGRRLGRWKPVLPRDCRVAEPAARGGLCDTPGDDYPWEAIDQYLRRSKEVLQKRVEALAAAEAERENELHPRARRAVEDSHGLAKDVSDTGDIGAETYSDATNANVSFLSEIVESESQNDDFESSGGGESEHVVSEHPSSGVSSNELQSTSKTQEGSGSFDGAVMGNEGTSQTSEDPKSPGDIGGNGISDENMAILVSFFTQHSGENVSKEAIKDMLAFKKTFQRPPRTSSRPSSTPQEDEAFLAEDLIVSETQRNEVAAYPMSGASANHIPQQSKPKLPEMQYYHSQKESAGPEVDQTEEKIDKNSTSTPEGSKNSEQPEFFLPPRAAALIARPPSVVEFNRKTSKFPVKNRITVQTVSVATRTTVTPGLATVDFQPTPAMQSSSTRFTAEDSPVETTTATTSHLPSTTSTPDTSTSKASASTTSIPSTSSPAPSVTPSTTAEAPSSLAPQTSSPEDTHESELDLFVETVYAEKSDDVEEVIYTSTIYGPDVKANVTRMSTGRPGEDTSKRRTTTTPLPSTITTLDPYTEPACQYTYEVRSPFYAMNMRNEWKTLINIPTYETFIHMEHCVEEKSRGRCAAGCRCTQKYSIRTMPVYDTDQNGCDVIYMDKFEFPSHCDCTCRPAHLMFAVTRPTSSPVRETTPSPAPTLAQVTPTPTPSRATTPPVPPGGQTKKQSLPQRPVMAPALPDELDSQRWRPMMTSGGDSEKPSFQRQPAKVPASTAVPMPDASDKPADHAPSRRRRPVPLKTRLGVILPTRRRPVPALSRATLVPQSTAAPVPARVPLVPTEVPFRNHRNRNRGPSTEIYAKQWTLV